VKARILAGLIAMLMWTVHQSAAAVYYVRATGLDTNAGTSPATAFRSLTKAVSVAQPGDTVYVGKGTYSGAVASVRSGSNVNTQIRFIGDYKGTYTGDKGTPAISVAAGTALTITHNWISFERFSFVGGSPVVASSGTSVSFTSCTIRSGTGTGVACTGGSLSLTGCTIYNVVAGAVITGSGSLTLTTTTIRNTTGSAVILGSSSAYATLNRSTIYSTGVVAFDQTAGTGIVSNSLIRNVPAGVRVSGGSLRVWNSTFDAAGDSVASHQGGTLEFCNNICANTTIGLIGTGATSHSSNLYWKCGTSYSGVTAHARDLYADPQFVNPVKNWNIKSTSPAIDMGTTPSGIIALDRNGAARPRGPAWDIGAYEVVGPSAGVPYFTDFESSATPGPEWTSTAAQTSASSSRFAGIYSNGTLGLRVATTPDTEYTLIFDVYFLSSWDGDNTQWGPDYFGVSIDGATEIRSTHSNIVGFPFSWPDFPETSRQLFYVASAGVYRSVVVDFVASSNVTFINFTGENLQGWSDEGWGVDNVRVVVTSQSAQYRPAYVESGRLNGFVRSGTTEAAAVLAADLTGDGYPDFVQTGKASAHSINTQGTAFTTQSAANLTRQASLADFDEDGDLDYLGISTSDTPLLRVNLGKGYTSLTYPGFLSPRGNSAVAAADLNADGLVDFAMFSSTGNWALINTKETDAKSSMLTPVTINSSERLSINYTLTADAKTFPQGLSVGAGAMAASGDVNGDGFVDFFLTSGAGKLLISKGDGTYTAGVRSVSISGGSSLSGACFADLDNDGDLDLIACDRTTGVTLWENNGSGMFSNVSTAKGLSLSEGCVAPAAGDFDNDGDLDILITTTGNRPLRLFRNSGSPSFSFTSETRQGVSIEGGGGDCGFVDVDLDGQLDIFVGSENTSYPSRLFSNQLESPSYLFVRVAGKGAGAINTAGVGSRVELWNAENTKLLQRRDIGSARALGQEPLIAHFGGVDPKATYTIRVVNGRRSITQTVVPALASTTVGTTTIPQMVTVTETSTLRVVRWREVSQDD